MQRLLLFAQAVAMSPMPDFDLEQVRPAPAPCGSASGEDIVVCGRRRDQRLQAPDERFEPDHRLPKAEVGVGGAKLSVEGEAASIGGIPTNRAMIRLKIPF